MYGMHHTGFTSQLVNPMYAINTKTNRVNFNSTWIEDPHGKPAKACVAKACVMCLIRHTNVSNCFVF